MGLPHQIPTQPLRSFLLLCSLISAARVVATVLSLQATPLTSSQARHCPTLQVRRAKTSVVQEARPRGLHMAMAGATAKMPALAVIGPGPVGVKMMSMHSRLHKPR